MLMQDAECFKALIFVTVVVVVALYAVFVANILIQITLATQ